MADRRLSDLLRRRPPRAPDPPKRHTLSDPIWEAAKAELQTQVTGAGIPPYDQNQAALERIYGMHPLVTACIRANASEAASVPVKLRAVMGDETEDVETHPILDTLRNPNTKMTMATMRLWIGMQVEQFGQGFLTIDGESKKAELWPMPASRVAVIPGDADEPIRGYTYTAAQGGAGFIGSSFEYLQTRAGGQTVPLAADDVCHAKYPNPWAADYYHGFSKVRELWTMLRRLHLSELWLQKFFEQGAVVPYAIEAVNELSEMSYQRLKASVEERMQGGGNLHKPFLAEAARVRKIGSTISEADPGTLETSVEDKILAAMGTPRTALFMPSGNFATARESTRLWYRRTIMPLNDVILDAINTSRFVTVYSSNRVRYELYADYSGVEALQRDRAAQATADSIYLTHGVPDPDNPERLAEALAVKAERADRMLEQFQPSGSGDDGDEGTTGEPEGPEDPQETDPEERGDEDREMTAMIPVAVWGPTSTDAVTLGASMGFIVADPEEINGEWRARLVDVPQCARTERKGMLTMGYLGVVRNGSQA